MDFDSIEESARWGKWPRTDGVRGRHVRAVRRRVPPYAYPPRLRRTSLGVVPVQRLNA